MKDFHKACQNIVDNRNEKALNRAVNYAKHGLTITNLYEAKIQALYILSNITRWRGELAKETRAILKKFTNPKWAKKYYNEDTGTHEGCPCIKMSKSYIRRKTRTFVKKNK